MHAFPFSSYTRVPFSKAEAAHSSQQVEELPLFAVGRIILPFPSISRPFQSRLRPITEDAQWQIWQQFQEHQTRP